MRIRRGLRTIVVMATALGLVAVVSVLNLEPVGAAPNGAPAVVVDVTTTTLVPPTTSTAPTTTTVPPTTTTTTVPTTTSRPARTTTTTPASTSTTAPLLTSTASSKTPWGLIILIAVLAVAIVVLVLVLLARKRRGIETQWRRAVVPALSDAQLARESLLSGNAVSDDSEVRGAVAVQSERAAVALEQAGPKAPDPAAGAMATSAAGALRGLAFAVEADRLLRHGTAAPTGVQLAQADEARRARTSELNTALAKLSTRIGSSSAARR